MITPSQLDRLEKLAALHRNGVLSDQEFEQEKAKILAEKPSAIRAALERTAAPTASTNDGFFDWALLPLHRYADFEGRSCRKEFWLFALWTALIYMLMFFMTAMNAGLNDGLGFFGWLILLVALIAGIGLLIPTVAVQVRRFHDQNKSGWFALLNLIPYVGGIVVLIFMCLPGTPGDNRFGPDPLR
ncbi:DUF805 domain-containing protein [Rhizorhabdus phycosphaerae]|uniref:DUF805 domain-containing protein n=1 Tax=Rhizorhabdus phycosphaerae TaxID=2711156 RepID=UPI0013EC085F|nr:DUF805 domain-containing protein [Rhizorhabdus phycosphaerae]